MVENLPPGDVLVDLFAGGCAVTHCAMLSGKWGRFVVNDVSDAPRLFIDAANGRYANETRIPTREEFFAQKDTDPYIRYLFSFGNNGKDYMFSREIEDVKVAASKMLVASTLDERYSWYRRFIERLSGMSKSWDENRLIPVERLESLVRLQGLQILQGLLSLRGLQSLQGLQGLQSLQSLQGLQSDYRSVQIPGGAVVYCDPPYRGTKCGCYDGFDFDAFDSWLASCGHLCVVSEYTAPVGCVEVAAREKQCSAAANGKSHRVTERLFVHESYLEEYRKRMDVATADAV